MRVRETVHTNPVQQIGGITIGFPAGQGGRGWSGRLGARASGPEPVCGVRHG